MSPFEKDEGYEKPNEQHSDSYTSRNNRWIVLVDDEESIRLAIGMLLYTNVNLV
jgi:hypothetical protein